MERIGFTEVPFGLCPSWLWEIWQGMGHHLENSERKPRGELPGEVDQMDEELGLQGTGEPARDIACRGFPGLECREETPYRPL